MWILAVAVVLIIAIGVAVEGFANPPPWAYANNSPGIEAPTDDGVPRRVPGSEATFTLTENGRLSS